MGQLIVTFKKQSKGLQTFGKKSCGSEGREDHNMENRSPNDNRKEPNPTSKGKSCAAI